MCSANGSTSTPRGDSLQTLVGGFTDVFPETALFVLHDGDALLIGSRGGFPVAPQTVIEERIARLGGELGPYGITDYRALRSWLTATSPRLDAWAAGAPRHRDDHPILEFRAPLSVHAATAFLNRTTLESLAAEPGFVPTFPPDAGRLAARAVGLLSAQNPDWALDLAQQALALDPGVRVAAETLLQASVASGRAAEGSAAFRAALGGVPPEGEAALGLTVALARLLLLAGQPDDAARVLESGPTALAEDREALLLAAEVQVERGDWDSAEALVLAVLRSDPQDAEAAAWLAELSVRRGRIEEAAERSAAILVERPETIRALRVRAVALAELGQARAAREAFTDLVERSPEPAFHWANFGAFELAAGRPAEALRLYREAVDRNPADLKRLSGTPRGRDSGGRCGAGPARAGGAGDVWDVAWLFLTSAVSPAQRTGEGAALPPAGRGIIGAGFALPRDADRRSAFQAVPALPFGRRAKPVAPSGLPASRPARSARPTRCRAFPARTPARDISTPVQTRPRTFRSMRPMLAMPAAGSKVWSAHTINPAQTPVFGPAPQRGRTSAYR